MAKQKEKKVKQTEMKIEYFDAIITCASCNTEFKTKSIKTELRIDICSNCHPFFTGENKILDSEGRVEKFKKKYQLLNKDKKEK